MSLLPTQAMSIAKKLAILNAGAILGIAILTAIFLISERTLILGERTSNVRQAVETAYGVLDYYQKQEISGTLPRAEAQKRAMEAIKLLRYGDNEYFWLNDMQPKMLMHPIKPDLDNKDLSSNQDPDGKFLFVEFVNTVKASGAGPVNYMWPKPGSDKPVPKVSYVKGFEPWGWIVGSGVYVDTVDATVRDRAVVFAAGAALLAAVLLGIGLFIARGMLRQLGGEPDYASSIARAIASGNLSIPITVKRDADNSIVNALKVMRDDLARIVSSVRTATDSIATASSEIAQGNNDLSARTENQASALEETAASMEELTVTVRQNADNARIANELAANASEVAQKGGAVVSQVVETMTSIDSSSRRIVDIISVIDGIAFQTNILALNAAVEAARAGEQGRGFAVVASEVRNLAQRSAAAAKEIKELIGASVETVNVGNTLVAQAGSTMQEVVESVQRVRQVIIEISTASGEQSAGLSQINEAISQMDAVTQQNAALVEQAAAAAASMQQQSAALLEAVSVFRVEADGLATPTSRKLHPSQG
ncbi:MAG: methyl-accepting chemotaxis protein [Comamonas sp.]|nr:methyl-accepting chemotaxis protein [Comamonas sp.]